MPDFLQFVATLREQMQAELTRTDALRPLIWPIAGLLLALTSALIASAPKWVLIAIVGCLIALLGLYIAGYVYFAIRDPDALRSEKYKLHKLAIEHGLYGDSTTGLIEPRSVDRVASTALIDAKATVSGPDQ